MATKLKPDDLLKLIADDELPAFCKLLGIKYVEELQRKELAQKIESCSRTNVFSALISVNGIWIHMMRDILMFLEQHGVSFRTTGCLFTLPLDNKDTLCELSPQLSDFIANFDESTYKAKSYSDWDSIEVKWRDDLNYWIQQVIRNGEPYSRNRQRDIVRVYLESRTSGRAQMYEKVVEVDRTKINQVFSLWRTLAYLANKLKPIDESNYPSIVVELADEIISLARELESKINNWMWDSDISYKINSYVDNTESYSDSCETQELFNDEWWQYDDQWDEWRLFVEDILTLAKLESSCELSDLLRLETLKDRPRLFEVWCMSLILKSYSTMGCKVELQSLKLGENPIWNLNYSRASEPVARIELNDNKWWLFFQLFQKGPSRANMPDLALLYDRTPDSDVIWIADPKYSEKGGYCHADYQEVAERYRDTFKAEHVWICEFFDRRNWFAGACSKKDNKFSILSEFQPNGEGLQVLNRELRQLHNFPLCKLVLAIDCSGSFIGNLQHLEMEIVTFLNVADVIICFADSTIEISDRSFASLQNSAKMLGGGTYLAPLISTLRVLPLRDSTVTDLILISDDGFSDSTDEMRSDLKKLFSHVNTVNDEISMRKIATIYGLI